MEFNCAFCQGEQRSLLPLGARIYEGGIFCVRNGPPPFFNLALRRSNALLHHNLRHLGHELALKLFYFWLCGFSISCVYG